MAFPFYVSSQACSTFFAHHWYLCTVCAGYPVGGFNTGPFSAFISWVSPSWHSYILSHQYSILPFAALICASFVACSTRPLRPRPHTFLNWVFFGMFMLISVSFFLPSRFPFPLRPLFHALSTVSRCVSSSHVASYRLLTKCSIYVGLIWTAHPSLFY
ncbi:hypothetical protein HETIRDRAFT_390067 [Heterobasidion irregulare TC 32-1]|uniref:Uncharacterized protein n=1 Tax=Heterobasidion irregulare (strain TC 32-1) TaxID=747525 RepID=W4JRK5_HETIT|nr:uncharacterized protein HETIRDRAFT_390067 [Heterobasidion irregulare TC 32-1]ETW75715.1 hypothetical protein HETIRDRAFT_390067 [Heterobasidion irregulare TC 32-1]